MKQLPEQSSTCAYSGLPSVMSYLKETDTSITKKIIFDAADKDRIIQMAWEDRTPFEAIEFQFGLKEK